MHTKSAKKRHRQSEENRIRNKSTRSSLKTASKKVHEAVKSNDLAKADELARDVAKKLDLAAAKKIIHRNAAARTKSRLQKLIREKKGKPAKAAAKA